MWSQDEEDGLLLSFGLWTSLDEVSTNNSWLNKKKSAPIQISQRNISIWREYFCTPAMHTWVCTTEHLQSSAAVLTSIIISKTGINIVLTSIIIALTGIIIVLTSMNIVLNSINIVLTTNIVVIKYNIVSDKSMAVYL